jgi:hypothetical protein
VLLFSDFRIDFIQRIRRPFDLQSHFPSLQADYFWQNRPMEISTIESAFLRFSNFLQSFPASQWTLTGSEKVGRSSPEKLMNP